MYHMELALIIYRRDNDYHARFIRTSIFTPEIASSYSTEVAEDKDLFL
jgi:hypothetical protein